MALIRRADIEYAAHDAVTLDLGDLAHQGEAIKHAARVEAQKILDAAKTLREQLIATAHRDGLAKGQAEGFERGRADGEAQALREHQQRLEELDQVWTEALERFESDRITMLVEARRDVLDLALRIARKVTHRAIELDERVAVGQLESVLGAIARPTHLTIAVHPDDEPLVREALPRLVARFSHAEHVEITVDAALDRGSCVARTASGGIIDASIQTQLDRIVRELLPGDGEAGAHRGAAA